MPDSAARAGAPEITVIVPSQTPGPELAACLAAVAFQVTKRSFEIVVMHSGRELSEGDLAGIPRVRVEEVDDALLPAAKKNLAAGRSRSRWLAFLDSDCIAAPNWLETLVQLAELHGVDGVGASIEIGEPKNAVTWPMHMLEYGRWLPAAASGPTADFATCGAVYRRDSFLGVGGFPDEIFPCCDTILNAKLKAAGHALFFTSRTSVTHQQFDDRQKLLAKSCRYGRAYAVAANRYRLPGHRLRGRAAIPVIMAGRLGRMVVRALAYRPLNELPYLIRSAVYTVKATYVWSRGVATGPLDPRESPERQERGAPLHVGSAKK